MRPVAAMGVMEFQDHTFEINDRSDRRLTDEQLLAEWKRQFPGQSAEVFVGDLQTGLRHIRSIRLLYNRGKQGHGRRDDSGRLVGRPDRLSLPYDGSGRAYVYSTRWWDSALNGRTPTEAGVPTEVVAELGADGESTASAPRAQFVLHHRYSRDEAFRAVGVDYTPQSQNLNVGLPPRNPDGSYFIFVTLDKEDLDSAFAYEDVLYRDALTWVTRKDRGEDHPDYVNLRDPDVPVHLFARRAPREAFAYLGPVKYEAHRQFTSASDQRIQQEYLFTLGAQVPQQLFDELAGAGAGPSLPNAPPPAPPTGAPRRRRPETLEEERKAFAYAVGRLERFVDPAHKNYQVRLGQFLKRQGLLPVWEQDFVDLRFVLGDRAYIGEIKVTGSLSPDEAFRAALGQLLDYADAEPVAPDGMLMCLDFAVDDRRLALATRHGVCVIYEREGGHYRLLNPSLDAALARVF